METGRYKCRPKTTNESTLYNEWIVDTSLIIGFIINKYSYIYIIVENFIYCKLPNFVVPF